MGTVFACALLGPLASASVFDLRERRIPNKLVAGMTMLWAVLCGAWLMVTNDAPSVAAFAVRGVCGALVLGGGSLLLASVFERVRGRDAFGGGDVKLLAVLGLYLGTFGGLQCLLVACVAMLVLAALIPRTRFANVPGSIAGQVPFAPALFVGAAFCVLL